MTEVTWWKSSRSGPFNQDCVEVGYVFATSSYSQGQSNCVEIGMREWDWKKSHYSTGQNNCVETKSKDRKVLVRDTKDRQVGMLTVSPGAWGAFLGHIA